MRVSWVVVRRAHKLLIRHVSRLLQFHLSVLSGTLGACLPCLVDNLRDMFLEHLTIHTPLTCSRDQSNITIKECYA